MVYRTACTIPCSCHAISLSICAPVVPSAWKAFQPNASAQAWGFSEGFSEAGHMLLLHTYSALCRTQLQHMTYIILK